MWNRQREAEEARERLALTGEDQVAPNRHPPPLTEETFAEPPEPSDLPADAAE